MFRKQNTQSNPPLWLELRSSIWFICSVISIATFTVSFPSRISNQSRRLSRGQDGFTYASVRASDVIDASMPSLIAADCARDPVFPCQKIWCFAGQWSKQSQMQRCYRLFHTNIQKSSSGYLRFLWSMDQPWQSRPVSTLHLEWKQAQVSKLTEWISHRRIICRSKCFTTISILRRTWHALCFDFTLRPCY